MASRKQVIWGVIGILVLGLLVFAVTFFTRFPDEVDVNLSAEQRKVYEDQIVSINDQLSKTPEDNTEDSKEIRSGLYVELGNSYYALGRLKDAKENYLKASELNPSDHMIWGGLYNVEMKRGDYHAAQEYIVKALSYYPNNPDYWMERLKLEREIFKTSADQTEQIYAEAFFKTNSNKDIVMSYAKFLEQDKGDLQAALNYWKIALSQQPDNAEIKQEIARLEALLK